VGSYESGELSGREALVEEQLEKAVVIGSLAESWRHGIVRSRGTAVGAADDGLDFWTTGTCNDCNAVGVSSARVTAVLRAVHDSPRGKLDQVRSSD
jgi:hypothetical protein